MPIELLLAETRSAGEVNEDVVGSCDGAAWVIDGATGVGGRLLESPSDAHWFAHRVDEELRRALSADPRRPSQVVLREVIERCRKAFESECQGAPAGAYEHPSAAFAMVRDRPDGDAELVTLGDCQIIFRTSTGAIEVHGASSIGAFEAQTVAMVAELLAQTPELTQEALRDQLLPTLRANRQRMNRPDGYWILGLEPAAAEFIDVRRLSRPAGDLALASDGFLRLTDLFGLADTANLLEIDDLASFEAWHRRLREAEREAESMRRFPRVKRSDDVSLVRIRHS